MFFFVVVLSVVGCSTTPVNPPADTDAAKTAVASGPDLVIEELGIEIVALRETAEGHMLDFRFRVLDAEKCKPFFDKKIKPALFDQKSGKNLQVPVTAKLGPMRPTSKNPPRVGTTYWMFFGNPGLVKAGDKVTIVLGDHRIEDLIVE